MGLEDLDALIAQGGKVEDATADDAEMAAVMREMWGSGERVVRLPKSDREAREMRMGAMPFEDEYVLPGEVVTVDALPTFRAHEDGIHVAMRCGGVVGNLLPLCVTSCVNAARMTLLRLGDELPRLGTPEAPDAPEVVEDLKEIGGFGWFVQPDREMRRRLHLHLHSIETGRGVVIGPLDLWEMREIMQRMIAAYAELPPDAYRRSVVRIGWGVNRPIRAVKG